MDTSIPSNAVTMSSARSAGTEAHRPFRSAAVLGAGTMGAQIAAHLANAGLEVLLLDVATDGDDRTETTRKGLERAKKLRPNPFFTTSEAARIHLGNFEDDLDRLERYEWVIEAVVERPDVKQVLFEKVVPALSEHVVLSTNTSGIPVAELAAALPEHVRSRFLGTHFFNPPRYLKLLEIIPTPETDQAIVSRLQRFGRLHLGKGIVVANDSPYFIGNRIGVYAMVRAMRHFLSGALSIEEIDLLTGQISGRPGSATFRTADIVGLDVLLDVLQGMHLRLVEDESRSEFQPPELLQALVSAGAIGAKVGAGFYRKDKDGLKKIDPQRQDYVPVQEPNLQLNGADRIPNLEERLRALYALEGRAGDFFRSITLDVLSYSARRIPEVAKSPVDLDRAMKWGFGWELGPFEQWDVLGFERVLSDMQREGVEVPDWIQDIASKHGAIYRHRGDAIAVYVPGAASYEELAAPRDVIDLNGIRSDARNVLWENDEAALLDLGANVALFEFRSKGNTLSQAVMRGLVEALEFVESDADLRGMVIGNVGKNFSVGANLAEMAGAVLSGQFSAVDEYLKWFQAAIQRVHYSMKPVVVCVHQRVLGGACELLMACPQPVAAAESYIGLVEVGVGLIPAGTGVIRLARLAAERSPNPFPSQIQPCLQKYFEQVVRASVSTSAAEAVEMGYAAGCPTIVMHDDRRLYVAREKVIMHSNIGYRPPPTGRSIRVLGRSTRAAFEVAVDQYRQGGFMSEYDAFIAGKLAYAMTGGDLTSPQDVSEEYLLDLEREVFLQLLGERRTQDRIKYMLENKKPLRN